MKEQLRKLLTWVEAENVSKEYVQQIDILIKTSTLKGVQTLGFPPSAAKIITQVVGDKWDYQAAKWWLETYTGQPKFPKEYRYPYSKVSNEYPICLCRSLELLEKLQAIPDEEKEKAYTSPKYRPLRDYFYLAGWKEDDEYPWELSYYSSDEKLQAFEKEITEEFTRTISYFITSDFFKDLLADRLFDPNKCKRLSYQDAVKEYVEVFKVRTMPVILNLGDYRWVDAGNGLSTFVREKMKNCGNSIWGGLRAANPKDNQILLLLDQHNNPHVIATWNGKFKDSYENEDQIPKRYIGHIEGVGSSQVKPEYFDAVKALFDLLQPEITSVEGEVAKFVGALPGGLLTQYPFVPKPKDPSLWY